MKICIVIQSEAFRNSAGMRIRYDRFCESLEDPDVTIEAATCAELAASKTLDHDVYVFCKTFDTAALLFAKRVRAAGKIVGQDVFDDYFSQYGDARLGRFRQWMREMAPMTHFALCTTDRMVEVLRAYMPRIPITPIEDPVAGFDPATVGRLADRKAARARESKIVEAVWFGIGDNPYFPVGLRDLASCEPQFARMARLGWDVRLRIVTNRRPFDATGAEILRRLSVGFEIVDWSEDAERDALVDATLAVIPVNGQSFSRAKSMNRAVTALNAGCQVLSLGYPLYERLGNFIYRTAEELIADLAAATPRLSADTIGALADRLNQLADPSKAAAKFVDAARLAMESSPSSEEGSLVCLIHGRTSKVEYHKEVGRIGGLSVGTMFSKAAWNFPVRFDHAGGEIVMRATPQVAEQFGLPVRHAKNMASVLSLQFVNVDTESLGMERLNVALPKPSNALLDLATYERVMRFAQECCLTAFPGAQVLISDTSPFVRRPARSKDARTPPRRWAQNAPPLPSPRGHRPWAKLGRFGVQSGRKAALARAAKLLAENPLMDAQWYCQRYPDVAASGVDPARHYLEFGWQEGRDPGPDFSTRGYLKANQDVAQQGINPLLHYIEHGREEGRKAPPAVKVAARS